jgi:hypothetical protein
LAALKAELTASISPNSIPSSSAIQPSADIPTTPKEKVSLFRRLFHDRNDVYPLLCTGRYHDVLICGFALSGNGLGYVQLLSLSRGDTLQKYPDKRTLVPFPEKNNTDMQSAIPAKDK